MESPRAESNQEQKLGDKCQRWVWGDFKKLKIYFNLEREDIFFGEETESNSRRSQECHRWGSQVASRGGSPSLKGKVRRTTSEDSWLRANGGRCIQA